MKRVFFAIILVILTSLYLPGSVRAADETASAATSWFDTGYGEAIKAAVSGDINSYAHITHFNTGTYSDAIRRVLGAVPDITISAEDMGTPYAEQMNNQSAMSGLSNYVYAMYANPPASTYAFVQDMGQSLGFIPRQAYAQGIGFSGLSPLLPIWKVFRNISYAILSIIMVVIGFMVMFRKKIDPKTVVTVQNALPKIVVTLLLITFSYAIVGIMIDLMYIALYLALQLIVSSAPSGIFGSDHVAVFTSSSFNAVWKGVFGGFATFPELINVIIPGKISWITKLALIATPTGGFGAIPALLIALIMAIAFLFAVVRLLFMLLSAYIQIIVAVLTGPIQIMLDAVPGSNGFTSWIKGLLSQLMVFPITSIMLTISYFLIKTSEKVWTPPLLGMGAASIGPFIGLGFLFVIPSTIKGLQEALKAKPMVNAGLGAIAGPFGAGIGQTMQLAYQASFVGSQFTHKTKPSTPPERLKDAGDKGAQGKISFSE